MKRTIYIFLLTLLTAFSVSAPAQQNAQWQFYLAFEDATGARDTVWIVLDEMATLDMDPDLGEVPIDMPVDMFSSYMYYSLTEYTDVIAFNINSSGFGAEVYCSDYVLPITLSWDRSLFHADVLTENGGDTINYAFLDNQWFFGMDAKAGLNMHLHDQVVMPHFSFGDGNHFPISVYIDRGQGIPGVATLSQIEVAAYPNPSSDYLEIKSPTLLEKVEVWDLSGRLMFRTHFTPSNKINIDVSSYPPGVYFFMTSSGGKQGVGKFVKVDSW